jgi:hypothetical protein
MLFQALVGAAMLAALAPAQAWAQLQPPIVQRQQLDSRPLQVIPVLIGTQQATMELRFHPNRTGFVAGFVAGDRLEGYHYIGGGRRTLALIRYSSANAAAQLFTADYNTSQAAWIGYAHGLAGASAAMVAPRGFRSLPLVQPRCTRWSRTPCPPPPPVAPSPPQAADAFDFNTAAIGFGVDANGYLGPLVLYGDASSLGAVQGSALGDAVRGRYAPVSGAIALVRYDGGGQPIQAWTGVFEQSAGKSGQGYPLGPNGGGPFLWRVTHDDHAIVGLRSTTRNNRCLTTGPAFTGACAREWLLFAVGRTGGIHPTTIFSLAHVSNGRCLDIPITPDGLVEQRPCIARAANLVGEGQELYLSNWRFYEEDDAWGFVENINTAAAFEQGANMRVARVGGLLGRCLAVQGSTGSITSGECDTDRANWTRLP